MATINFNRLFSSDQFINRLQDRISQSLSAAQIEINKRISHSVTTDVDGYLAFYTDNTTVGADASLYYDTENNQLRLGEPLKLRSLESTPGKPPKDYGLIYVENDTPYYQDSLGNTYDLTSGGTDVTGLEITVDEHYSQHSGAIQTIIKELDGYITVAQDGASIQTVQEHYNQHSQAIQTILGDLDGYNQTIEEHYAQHSTAIQTILGDLDGYNQTIEEHYNQHSQAIQTILGDLDGYVTTQTEGEHHEQLAEAIRTIVKDLDGYNETISDHKGSFSTAIQTILKDLDGYAADSTVSEHYAQHSAALQSVLKDLDGYAADSTVSEHYTQHSAALQTILKDLDGYSSTIGEHYTQHSAALQTILKDLDGYAADSTVGEHYAQHSAAIQTILKDLDGYAADSTVSEHYAQHSGAIQTILKDLDGYIISTSIANDLIPTVTNEFNIGNDDLYFKSANIGSEGIDLIYETDSSTLEHYDQSTYCTILNGSNYSTAGFAISEKYGAAYALSAYTAVNKSQINKFPLPGLTPEIDEDFTIYEAEAFTYDGGDYIYWVNFDDSILYQKHLGTDAISSVDYGLGSFWAKGADDLTIHPSNGKAYILGIDGIYTVEVPGLTSPTFWTAYDNPSDDARGIVVDPNTNNMYIAIEDSIYELADPGASEYDFSTKTVYSDIWSLVNQQPSALAISSDGYLAAKTTDYLPTFDLSTGQIIPQIADSIIANSVNSFLYSHTYPGEEPVFYSGNGENIIAFRRSSALAEKKYSIQIEPSDTKREHVLQIYHDDYVNKKPVLSITADGYAGFGGVKDPHEAVVVDGVVSLYEQSAIGFDVDGYGRIYVQDGSSNLIYRNEDGVEYNLSSIGPVGEEEVGNLGESIQTILKELDGYDQDIISNKDYIDAHGNTIQTILKGLDGYEPEASAQEFKGQTGDALNTIRKDLDGYSQTISEHYTQHSTALHTITKDLDGYVHTEPREAAYGDGYVAFFTGEKSVAGDNDLYWDRANNRLVLNSLKIPSGAVDTYVLTTDGNGIASWQEAPGSSSNFNDIVIDDTTGNVVADAISGNVVTDN